MATAQSMSLDQQVETTERPKITVSGPESVSITEWDKLELSVKAEVAGGVISGNEVRIAKNNDKIDITCPPAYQGKAVSMALVVPKKAVVTVNTNDSKVEIREPVQATAIKISYRYTEVNVPPNSKLDLKTVSYAQLYKPLGPGGFAITSVAGQIVGLGPPYLRFNKTNSQVIINHPANLISNRTGPGPLVVRPAADVAARPLTIAAQMIAIRGGVMGKSLQKTEPRLAKVNKDTPAGATTKPDEASDVNLESQLVNLNVTVTDRDGRSIAGLKPEDFSVYEDGVLQKISYFEPEQSPFNLVLLLDMSGSVESKRPLIVEAALHFLEVIGPKDKVAVVTFTDDVISVSHLTDDREDLRDSISHLVFPTGGTAFYDALGYSLVEELRKVRKQRNAVVVLTDGEDNRLLDWVSAPPQSSQVSAPMQSSQSVPGSINVTIQSPRMPNIGSFLTFEQLLDGVRESDALIYPVHIDTNQSAQPNLPNLPTANGNSAEQISATAKKQLQELANASGGRVYNAALIEDIAKIYEQVAAEMRTVYSVAYTPTNTAVDGKLRSIKVKINRPDAVARTRPGYYPK